MIIRLIVSTAVAWFVGLVSSPNADVLSALVNSTIAAFLCFVPLFILSRCPLMKSAAGSVQTLVSVLICLLALSALASINMAQRIAYLESEVTYLRNDLNSYTEAPPAEPSPDSSEEGPQSPAGESSEIPSYR